MHIQTFSKFLTRSLLTLGLSLGMQFGVALVAHAADTTPPTVSSVTPTTGQQGVSQLYSANYSDDTGVTNCFFYYDSNGQGGAYITTPVSGVTSITTNFLTPGEHTFRFLCVDAMGNRSTNASTTITIASTDTQPPVITNITPATALPGVQTTVSATCTDWTSGVILSGAYFTLDGAVVPITPTYTGDLYQKTFSVPVTMSAGSHTLYFNCQDTSENIRVSSAHTITVAAADTQPPTIGAITPSTVTAGVETTFSATCSDTSGIGSSGAYFTLDGTLVSIFPSSTGGSTSKTFSVPLTLTAGSHTLYFNCQDNAENIATSSLNTITATAPGGASDTQAPVVGSITPTIVTAGVNTTFSANFSDNVGVTQCYFDHDGINNAVATRVGTTSGYATYQLTSTLDQGIRVFQVRCLDAAGNVGYGTATAVNVTAASPSADTTAPVVNSVSPTTATAGVSTSYSAYFSDNVAVTQCLFYVDGNLSATANRSGATSGYATYPYTLAQGTHTLQVRCQDAANNTTYGPSTIVTISASNVGSGTVPAGSLVKLACPGYYVDPNDPCKAVYYVDQAGKRHAFPNEQAYFSWYSNFDSVLTISNSAMAQMTLGKNVNYRPGVRMVKFQTVPKVYVVARGGVLRWITSEQVAIDLYGSAWNKQVDDISEAFYTNYTFGADINSSSQFNVMNEMNAAATIEANL